MGPQARSDFGNRGGPTQPESRVAALEREVAALRASAAEADMLRALVTQLRDANEHLVLASVDAQTRKDEAEAANRRQNEFLAMLAHELRNPLAPIAMAASLLEKMAGQSPQLQQLQAIVSRQVGHIARLLDDLLDAARISSGKITLHRQPVALGDIIDRAVETVMPRIAERRQDLQVELTDRMAMIDGDPVRLTQVLSNLLVNAAKFSHADGRITVHAGVANGHAFVAVRDEGMGIASELLPHVFDLFIQGPTALARSEGGLGIGLNVVRNLVQMHGGQVTAASEGIDRGTTFTVALPVLEQAAGTGAPGARASPAAAPPCRILLVEDNRDACEAMQTYLAHDGHTVSTAHDGERGPALALEQDFDVIISDIGLPGIDGLDLMARVRERCGGAAPYSIALSGYGQAADQERALAAGYDLYLVKPVQGDALLQVIAARAA